MSGGEFNYIQYQIEQTADELNKLIKRYESDENSEYDYNPEYSEDTLNKFKDCELTLRSAAVKLHRVDWLISGDDGEETFHKRLEKDLSELERSLNE